LPSAAGFDILLIIKQSNSAIRFVFPHHNFTLQKTESEMQVIPLVIYVPFIAAFSMKKGCLVFDTEIIKKSK